METDREYIYNKEEPPVLILHWPILVEVINSIGRLRAESGGPIGSHQEHVGASHFHFDESSRRSAVTYSPDYKLLNRLFKTDWNPKGIRLCGFIHSHPGRMNRPSCGDEVYAERILKAIEDLECLWLPIVNTIPDTGQFSLVPWAVYRAHNGVTVVRGRLQVVHAPAKCILEICRERVLEAIQAGKVLEELVIGKRPESASVDAIAGADTDMPEHANLAGAGQAAAIFDTGQTFERVVDAYDLPLMKVSRIIAVGAGGAADWLEQLARAGVGQFVMIDPDAVSETNLATQQTYRRDIGRPKVDCIAERIRDVNPTARVIALQKSLDDLTDTDIRRLAFEPIDGCEPVRTVLCGLTDNFFAQARVNRLALHLGLPSLCAQVYREGRAAEITFTFAGATPACHRCILSSRYRYFLEQGQTNNVTSHGTPIFATTRLNAIKGFVTLALLHHGSDHPRWGRVLSRIGKRNLIQVRMDPDLADTLGMTVFDRVFQGADKDRLFFDEVVWLPQDQECIATGYPSCPDCGGTGDLRDAIGRFDDTRSPQGADVVTPAKNLVGDASVRRTVEAYKQNGRMR